MAGNSSVLLGEGGERTWMLGVGEETLSIVLYDETFVFEFFVKI